MIVIGASLGGLSALKIVLKNLPADFPSAIAIVLHRHRETGDLLLPFLHKASVLEVVEAVDKEPLRPGVVYIAPADYHLLVEPTHVSLSVDEPVFFARPSIDVLFESAADSFNEKAIGVILSGGSADGALGAAQIMRRGGRVLVQDPDTAECSIMPLAALNATRTPHVKKLEEISGVLIEFVKTTPH